MKTNTKLKYLPIAAFAAVAVALAGCGGGGSSPVTSAPADTPTIAVADLGADGTIEAGTYQLTGTPEELLALAAAIAGIDEPPEGGYAPGETVTIPGFADLTCTGDVNCTVMVAEDGTVMTTGTIMTAALGEGPGTEPMPTTQIALTAAEEAVAAAKEALEALEALEGDEAATPAQIATAEAAVLTAEEARCRQHKPLTTIMLLQPRRPLRQPLLKPRKGRKDSQPRLTVRKGSMLLVKFDSTFVTNSYFCGPRWGCGHHFGPWREPWREQTPVLS